MNESFCSDVGLNNIVGGQCSAPSNVSPGCLANAQSFGDIFMFGSLKRWRCLFD
jgi:hypothetical protein